jgi:hypothetical protein
MTYAKRPLVGIVVINLNGKRDTLECLGSLTKIYYPNYRIFLVDNGSTEQIREELNMLFPQVEFIRSRVNLGFTGGNNLGARIALLEGASFVLFLNNDTTVAPDFLDRLVQACQTDPRIGMATPKIYFYGQPKVIWACGASIDRITGRTPHTGVYQSDQGQYDKQTDVDRITGCAMLVRRELIQEIGLFDERFFIYGEETDWCLRAKKAGYRLITVPDSVIWHKGHRDSGRIGRPFITYLQTRNHLLLLCKHQNQFALQAIPAILYTLGIILKELFIGASSGRKDHVKAILLGMLDSFRRRYGKPPYF